MWQGVLKALVTKNYSALGDTLSVPFVVVDAAPRVIATLESVVEGLRRTREAYDAKGYSNSEWGTSHVFVLQRDRVLVNRTLRHYKADGTMLEQRANFYLAIKTPSGWRISGVIPQDPIYSPR